MAHHAAALVPAGARVLTHCNAGGLATGGYGTAVGAVRAACEQGLVAHVWVDETRPLLQGARLTACELEAARDPVRRRRRRRRGVADGAGEVDLVVTGADRIAANGDTANKIGTYGLAVLAGHHGIPFVVVAPTSTLDPAAASGADIPIEERDGAEITDRFPARNPAFDVTPAALITADRDRGGRAPAAVRRLAADAGEGSVILDEVDPAARELLERFGFDEARFEEIRSRVASGELSPATNVVQGVVEPPRDGRPDRAARARVSRASTRHARPAWRRCARAAWRRSCSRAAWRRVSAASSRASSRRSTAAASSSGSSARPRGSETRSASRSRSR